MSGCAYKDVVVVCAEDAYEKGMDLPFISVGMEIEMNVFTTYKVQRVCVQGNAERIVLYCNRVQK